MLPTVLAFERPLLCVRPHVLDQPHVVLELSHAEGAGVHVTPSPATGVTAGRTSPNNSAGATGLARSPHHDRGSGGGGRGARQGMGGQGDCG